jgi:hypothetical protein
MAILTPLLLEVLVRYLRLYVTSEDPAGRNRILEWIIKRIQMPNEQWTSNALKNLSVPPDERYVLLCDL